jgi:hypothetical protein
MAKEYPEVLLVRLTKAQKVFIRKYAKKYKVGEAETMRFALEKLIREEYESR